MSLLQYLFASMVFSISLSSCKPASEGVRLSDVRGSIFKIEVRSQSANFRKPWEKKRPSSGTGSGFYIGKNRILTNAHVVANAKSIRVQNDGNPNSFSARVSHIAHSFDLAILELEEVDVFAELKPLEFGDVPSLQEKVEAIGYPLGGDQLSITEGVVSRIGYSTYVHNRSHSHLLIQVDSAINPGNSGGPVFNGSKVVGVAFQSYRNAQNTGYIIPVPVIKRFLRDVEDGSYEGPVVVVDSFQNEGLENPALRSFLGLKDGMSGVLVPRIIFEKFPFPDLRENDVILSVNDKVLGNDGKISLYDERVSFLAIFDRLLLGESVKLKIWRDQKIKEIEVGLEPYDLLDVWEYQYIEQPRYFIYGGLVFTSVSFNFIETWGNKWYREAPLIFRSLYQSFLEMDASMVDGELVVLSYILPDALNQHAQSFENQLVESVNGRKVSSLDELARNLDDTVDEFSLLHFYNRNKPLVLEAQKIKREAKRILDDYRVFSPSYLEDTRDGAINFLENQ